MGMRRLIINATGGECHGRRNEKTRVPFTLQFSVKSHDEKEIIEMAKQHAKKSHNMEISEKELKEMIRPA